MGDFERKLEELINAHSKENESNTPDFMLATFMLACLKAFNEGVNRREKWYSRPGADTNEAAINVDEAIEKPAERQLLNLGEQAYKHGLRSQEAKDAFIALGG